MRHFSWRACALLLTAMLAAGCSVDPKSLARFREVGNVEVKYNSGRLALAHLTEEPTPLPTVVRSVDDRVRIAYIAMVNGVAQVFSVQPDGARGIQLTMDPRYKCRPVWSLDHRRIAFFRYPGDHPLGQTVDLVVMNENGSDLRDVKTGLKVNVDKTRASWSPDGASLYVQEQDFPSVLFGYAVADGRQTDTIRLPKKTFLNQAHSLSPDALWIAGSGPDKVSGQDHIGTVRRADGKDMDLMRPLTKTLAQAGMVVWSYDGRRVAFEVSPVVIVMSSAERAPFEVYPLSAPDTNAELSDPAFSPSGEYLACVVGKAKEGNLGSGDREVSSDIWVMRTNGKQPHQVTTTGVCYDPHW